MKTSFLKYLFAGTVFGIVMIKSEAASWYRIREMFLFQSFHMYSIIGTAVISGVAGVWLIRKFKPHDTDGNPIVYKNKTKSVWRYLAGGTLFGFGWALTGACPGPLFVNLGYGTGVMAAVIAAAWLGTLVYGWVRDKLPH